MGRKPSWAKSQWFEVWTTNSPSFLDKLVGKYKTHEKAASVVEEHKAAGILARVVECNRL